MTGSLKYIGMYYVPTLAEFDSNMITKFTVSANEVPT